MFGIPVNIQTKTGVEYAGFIGKEFYDMKSLGLLDMFRDMIISEKCRIRKNLDYLLTDKHMEKKFKLNDEDSEGWKLFKEMSDIYSILNHYGTRI